MEIRIFYSIPSLILYFLVLAALVKERNEGVKATKYFYLLLIAQSILNIVAFLNSFYLNSGMTTSSDSPLSFLYAKAPSFVCSIVYATAYHMVFVEMYMTFFISLYRMTMITHPMMHVKIWKLLLPLSITISLLTPLFCTYNVYVASGFFEMIADCFYVNVKADVRLLMTEVLIFLCILILISLLVNITSVVILCIRTNIYDKNKLERNMLVLALLDFLVKAVYFALYIVIYTNPTSLAIAVNVNKYASDVLTFSNAYLLVILNKRIRDRIRSFFRHPQKAQKLAITKTVAANSSQQARGI